MEAGRSLVGFDLNAHARSRTGLPGTMRRQVTAPKSTLAAWVLAVASLAACGRVKDATDAGDAGVDLASDGSSDAAEDLASEEPQDGIDASLDAASDLADAAAPTNADTSFVGSKSCDAWAQTFCDVFARCATARGVPGLLALRYDSMSACVTGVAGLCKLDRDVYQPTTHAV